MKRIIVTILLLLLVSSQAEGLKSFSSPQTQPLTKQEARVLGNLTSIGDDVLTAPDTVQAGQEFQITVTTSGGGCERIGDTGVLTTDNSATVMVYDFTSATQPGVACTMIFKRMPHTVPLRFTKPGDAIIRVWGRRIGNDTPPAGGPIILEHRILVK